TILLTVNIRFDTEWVGWAVHIDRGICRRTDRNHSVRQIADIHKCRTDNSQIPVITVGFLRIIDSERQNPYQQNKEKRHPAVKRQSKRIDKKLVETCHKRLCV